MDSQRGLIFNIQRYSLNDGEGIRTIVFFKGCPLKCPWCSNPESQKMSVEYMKNRQEPNLLKKVGKWYTVDEVMKEVLKDQIFFDTSGGGVTLSGGEILAQGKFLINLVKELKEYDINVVIETSGYGNKNTFKEILPYIDTILFDFKIIDDRKSKDIIGGEFKLIYENFKEAIKDNNVIPRIPYIPRYTDDMENIDNILEILIKHNMKEIHLLPYHNYGESKYELLNMEYELEMVEIPSEETVEKIKKYIEKKGFKVVIGG